MSPAQHSEMDGYGYDAAGNLTSSVDFDNRVLIATYDGDNRLVQSVAVTTTQPTLFPTPVVARRGGPARLNAEGGGFHWGIPGL